MSFQGEVAYGLDRSSGLTRWERRVISGQNNELANHSRFAVARDSAEQSVNPRRIQLIRIPIGRSRWYMNVYPVLRIVGGLDDEGVIDAARIRELDPSRNACSDLDSPRLEAKLVVRADSNGSLWREVYDANRPFHMCVRPEGFHGGRYRGVVVVAMLPVALGFQGASRIPRFDQLE